MSAFDIHYCFAGKDVDLKGKKPNYKNVHAKVELKGRQFFPKLFNSKLVSFVIWEKILLGMLVNDI